MNTSTVPNLPTMLHALLSEISVSSTSAQWDTGNIKVIHKLADWLGDLGFTIEIQTLQDKPDKANLIATLGTGAGGLVLAGHTDTVPFDEGRWAMNPLALTEKDNRFYGLGSTDMKGFFPIAIEAAKAFVDKQLDEPLIILATCDEESSMDGARALAAQGYPKARYAVIGEPTNLRPIHAHKGVMMNAITITGRSGHSSNPALGNNALEAMTLVLNDFQQFRAELQQRYQSPLFEINVPTMNLGCIHGGDNPNRICGECELHFDVRCLPGMESEVINNLLHERLQPIAEQLSINISLRELVKPISPFEQDKNSDWVKICEKLTGHTAETVAFGTEAPFLKQLGMQTIVMGPGSIDQAHQPNEYMAMEQVQPAIDLLKALIQRCCFSCHTGPRAHYCPK